MQTQGANHTNSSVHPDVKLLNTTESLLKTLVKQPLDMFPELKKQTEELKKMIETYKFGIEYRQSHPDEDLQVHIYCISLQSHGLSDVYRYSL